MDPTAYVLCILSLEDGNRTSFPKVVFSSYLEFRMMDKVQKPSDSGLLLFWRRPTKKIGTSATATGKIFTFMK
jgi:hypothetical protein